MNVALLSVPMEVGSVSLLPDAEWEGTAYCDLLLSGGGVVELKLKKKQR